ncbi:hypothetical protein [Bacillus atrophaeus]|uniref:hypothetical protein n=1 Tax=Bacillus atrophaeus TaxID=1452 RepID=UPI002E1D823C|nr:hypothetical protein [Bacillus atrophaeus]
MYAVIIYVKPGEVLTVDKETGEILRRITGCHRDLLISSALQHCENASEVPTIIYQKEETECTVYPK